MQPKNMNDFQLLVSQYPTEKVSNDNLDHMPRK